MDRRGNWGLEHMELKELSEQMEDAFVAAAREYRRDDPESYKTFFKVHFGKSEDWDKQGYENLLRNCARDRQDWRPRAGKTSVTRYALMNGPDTVLGWGVLRFPLSEDLERSGGNLLFAVPPSLRGQGFGTLTLNRLLFEAVRAGLARALVSCPAAQAAVRRCIEKNRGELDLDDGFVARYWIRFR